ncbi:hypothetical protein C8R46DRAFT_1361977 [Mycena filopes]|nr:hypothetical protein C8R46DRAFT_1361977 [Mycena filopes]
MYPSSKFHLPNEMWFEIFKNLPTHALRSVHGVSALFRDISHPLFFRDFTLDPDKYSIHRDDELIARLGMYSSHSIAPHIRKLSVSFQLKSWLQTGFITALSLPTPLVTPLLQTISHFRNLRTLECKFRSDAAVHFEDLGLQDLPHLRDLRIDGGGLLCPIWPTQLPAQKISVTHFSYTSMPSITLFLPLRSLRFFLYMLDPSTLSSLTLSAAHNGCPAIWVGGNHDLCASFRALRTVAVECTDSSIHSMHWFLLRLPALEELTLRRPYRDRCTKFEPATDGPCLVRTLRAYSGPVEYLALFLRGTDCAQLTINAVCTPEELRHAVKAAGCTSSVLSLSLIIPVATLHLWDPPPSLFDDGLFPCLTALRVCVLAFPPDEDDGHAPRRERIILLSSQPLLPKDFPARIAALFHGAPPSLEDTVIEWDVGERDITTANMLSGLKNFHAAVRPHLPGKLVFEGFGGRVRVEESEPKESKTVTSERGPGSDANSAGRGGPGGPVMHNGVPVRRRRRPLRPVSPSTVF